MREQVAAVRARWGVSVSERQSFKHFEARFTRLASNAGLWQALEEDYTESAFALIVGHTGGYARVQLGHATSLNEFMAKAQQLVLAMDTTRSKHLDRFLELLEIARDYSPGVDFEIARRGKRSVTFFPAGAAELDTALVTQPLQWLSDYPAVAGQYEAALTAVLAHEDTRAALDNLRWALEQLLRAVLGNSKPLEKQREPLLRWLKERGTHQHVINMYADLLAKYTSYQNEAVKHGDQWTATELEFMVYLTGTFMRLLLSLSRKSAQRDLKRL